MIHKVHLKFLETFSILSAHYGPKNTEAATSIAGCFSFSVQYLSTSTLSYSKAVNTFSKVSSISLSIFYFSGMWYML